MDKGRFSSIVTDVIAPGNYDHGYAWKERHYKINYEFV